MNEHAVDAAKRELEDELGDETLIALFHAYASIYAKDRKKPVPPHIDLLYSEFRGEWVRRMLDFITANPDYWEIPTNIDIEDVEGMMASLDFPVPSHKQVLDCLNYFGVSYVSPEGFVMNTAVVQVW